MAGAQEAAYVVFLTSGCLCEAGCFVLYRALPSGFLRIPSLDRYCTYSVGLFDWSRPCARAVFLDILLNERIPRILCSLEERPSKETLVQCTIETRRIHQTKTAIIQLLYHTEARQQ